MARTCELCGKHPVAGKTVSHAHNVNNRIVYPNLRTIKASIDGTVRRTKICMKCLKRISLVK